jgi:DeoR family transcriptional regulator, fructose operon transcriptional repressor
MRLPVLCMMEQSAFFNPSERQQEIRILLQEHGHLTVSELSLRLKVSEMTIRRDLKTLASHGLIHREHGGAAFQRNSSQPEDLFFNRLGEAEKEKTAIGHVATSLIHSGESIILDAGTSTLAIAKAIHPKELVVITNSVPISTILTGQEGVTVLLTGGEVRKSTYALVGPLTRSSLSHFYADKLFLGATGISLSRGLSTTSLQESEIKQAMIQSAKEVILVAHSQKFGEESYHIFAKWNQIHTLITDDKLSDLVHKELLQRGIRVLIAPVNENDRL